MLLSKFALAVDMTRLIHGIFVVYLVVVVNKLCAILCFPNSPVCIGYEAFHHGTKTRVENTYSLSDGELFLATFCQEKLFSPS